MHMLKIVVLLFVVHLLCGSCGKFSFRLVGAADTDVLLTLKRGFLDPDGELASWNQSTGRGPCEDWKGIHCVNGSIVSIELPGCFRGGQISSAISELRELQSIDFSSNFLNGTIPEEISLLNNLVSLNLANNLLYGSLPQRWNNFTKLEAIILTGNALSGSIPSGLFQAVNLQRLRLENNSLSGSLPSEISSLGRLKYLAVEYNQLTGPIPEEIGNLISLRSVYAAYNQLNGTIPDGVGNLDKLVHFEVENNRLSGPIPASLGNLTASLHTLNLSYNALSGEIPAALSTKFSAASFENNPTLCGLPLSNCTVSSPPPPPTSSERQSPPQTMPPPGSRTNRGRQSASGATTGKIVGGVVGGVAGSVVVVLLLLLLRRSNQKKDSGQVQNWFSPEIQANGRKGKFEMFGRSFKYTYEEVVSHAGYFDTAHVLGKGRFATVYRSNFPDGTDLAVKVFKYANVCATFEKDIAMLASIRHRHLLSIKGFYSNPVEKAVLNDYLPKGTLYDLLHCQDASSAVLPDWAVRQRIAVGIAQAVAYLHRGCNLRVLHKDIKSSNVLLDADLLPRVCDFGLVQLVSSNPHENACVVETPGYAAPELLVTKKYSEKTDVYSFGVVLLELITGKKAVSYIEERAVNLTGWVTRLQKENRGKEVMDPVVLRTCPLPEHLEKVLRLAVLCVDGNPSVRPTMSEVASILESLIAYSSPLLSPELRADRQLLQ